MKFFTPRQDVYQVALRSLAAIERELACLKRKQTPNYIGNNLQYPEEIERDASQIPHSEESLETFRLGCHFAALTIAHQTIADLSQNQKFVQSIGQLEDAVETLWDLKETAHTEDLKREIEKVANKITTATTQAQKAYPLHHIIEMAMVEQNETPTPQNPTS